MTSIRKYVYAGLLVISGLNLAPSWASAQEVAHGRFTLTHDVHWQKALVPAGEYHFSVDSDGVARVVTLSSTSAGFLLMSRDFDETPRAGSGPGRLVLEKTPEGSYVSAMQLPEFGMTLHFSVPVSVMAKGGAVGSASGK